MSKLKNGLVRLDGFLSRRVVQVAAVAGIAAPLAFAGTASAAATYDISPVTTSITSELAANLPTILAIMGGLVALGIAVKAVRKFAKV